MTTLAFDTATPRPSLAITAGDRVVAESNLGAIEGGGRRVLEAVHEVLDGSGISVGELDRIVVGVGPGGFTGIRIGIATALGLGHAAGVPVVGCSSLEALALGLARETSATTVATAIDARRREVFAAIYELNGEFREVSAPVAAAPDEFAERVTSLGEGGVAVGGNGVEAYGDAFASLAPVAVAGGSAANYPMAVNLVRRVDDGGGRPARPVYCRLPDAEEKRREREARGG